MARIEEIERRLLNWARWKQGAGLGGLGYASVSLTDDTSRGAYREARIPTFDVEADQTDRAIDQLPNDLRYTVYTYYLGSDGVEKKARTLCCSVATMYARIERTHRMLQERFRAEDAARQVERERVEKLQKVGARSFTS